VLLECVCVCDIHTDRGRNVQEMQEKLLSHSIAKFTYFFNGTAQNNNFLKKNRCISVPVPVKFRISFGIITTLT